MSARDRIRLDQLLVDRGLASSREWAKRLILAGKVRIGGVVESKPGTAFPSDCELQLEATDSYASRGGEKLARAVEVFKPELEGIVAVDVGASTGGFTDVLLRCGASMVYCVDVGYGQLAWNLRQDPRVRVFDRTNARYLTPEMFDPLPSFATIDVSFISLSMILPAVSGILRPNSQVICLVKPQFEAGRERVGKRGVVRSPEVHCDVLRSAVGYARQNGFAVLGLTSSPIRGPEGNIEFLMYLALKSPEGGIPRSDIDPLVESVVSQAHSEAL